ncbi:hypothetical protein GCM10009608_24380 [Pseudonocardia alaniniphila]
MQYVNQSRSGDTRGGAVIVPQLAPEESCGRLMPPTTGGDCAGSLTLRPSVDLPASSLMEAVGATGPSGANNRTKGAAA